jgi:hypothetical protein
MEVVIIQNVVRLCRRWAIVAEIMSDHSIYLRVSGVYVHESCFLGAKSHHPTYVKRGRFQHGPKCDICSVTAILAKGTKCSHVARAWRHFTCREDFLSTVIFSRPQSACIPGLISPPKQRQHVSPLLSAILPGNYRHLCVHAPHFRGVTCAPSQLRPERPGISDNVTY